MVDRIQNDKTKRAMLAAIREHLAASKPFDEVHKELHSAHATERLLDNQPPALGPLQPSTDTVERFRKSLEAVNGHCLLVRNEREAAEAVQQIVDQTGARHLAISNSPLVESVINQVKWEGELLEHASASALFASDLGLSEAQWGVAETGTLILESDRERHRLVSLVPPVHIALLQAHQIRETLAEALKLVSENGEEALSRAVTFITGASRTSDIELTLAIGVHGPTQLHVIIISR